ncbi:MAG: serine hydrolase [Desulfobulbaceae bacterium]|nr:MAG: serine hydrolase [Desulfobulbaceae bacterium]
MTISNIVSSLSKILDESLLSAYNNKVFSACSVGVIYPAGKELRSLIRFIGETGRYPGEKVTFDCLYDLASLTKPIVITLSILKLIKNGLLDFKTTVGSVFIDETVADTLRNVNIKDLLCHNAGLVAHRDYWQKMCTMESHQAAAWLLENLLSERVDSAAEKHVYSDLGYMLLGFMIEKLSGQRLDSFFNTQIAKPLGLQDTLFYPVSRCPKNVKPFAATGYCPWSNDLLHGTVHDDNCRSLGGVAGHAGLFGTISAVNRICEELLRLMENKPSELSISSTLFDQCTTRIGNSEWTAGFNLPSGYGSSSGRHFSSRSIGHLGFTGTSFWIDPDQKVAVSLLTNRVIMGENQLGIKKLRPRVHNRIMELFLGK